MSSLYTQFQFEILIIFSICILLVAYLRWLRYWHVGYGVELVFKVSDGSVFVTSRLLNYPAHLHCISNKALIVSIDGTPMQFSSGEEFLGWFREHRLKSEVALKWVVRNPDGKEIIAVMKPVLIMSKIPAYWSPNLTTENGEIGNWRVNKSICYCSKTGQYFMKKRLSVEALRRVFF